MTDIVEQARALARLAENATQGPWEPFVHRQSNTIAVFKGGTEQEIVAWQGFDNSKFAGANAHNAKLIAAAPEMARLLGELADELKIARLFHRQAVLERDLERHRNTKAVDEVVVQRKVLRDLIEAATEGVALNVEQFHTAKHEAWRKKMLESIDAARRMLEMG